LGPLYGSHIAVTHFKNKKKGIIINTNSTGAFVGNPYTISYSASKFGLRGLSEALRYELKTFPEIFVCDIYAGFVDTPAFSHAGNYIGKEIKPAKPLVDPEKVVFFFMEKTFSSYFKRASVVEKSNGNLFGPDYDRTFIHGDLS